MASFSAGTTFTDGVANDVTATKLAALVNNATPTSGLIQDRTAETITATNDTLLIGDASDSNTLKRITVANFAQTLPTAKITTGTIETGTFGTTTSTVGTVTTLTAGTTTSTAATITTGTITTGVIPTLTSTTLITSGTGTAAAPAIVPTGDTNTGLFFPAADTIGISTQGTEAIRIDSGGKIGIGGTADAGVNLHIKDPNDTLTILRVENTATDSFPAIQLKNDEKQYSIQIQGNDSNKLYFYDSTLSALRMVITSSGDVLVTSNALLGYGSGAGGTVTQSTNKSTSVTLNKPTGQITMSTATLANGASVSFALSNTFISAVDVLSVNATAYGGYTSQCVNTSTGAATIRLTNISGGSLSEAVTLQFVVLKGAAT